MGSSLRGSRLERNFGRSVRSASGYAEGAGGSIKFISIANAPVGTYRIILTQYLNYAGGAFQIGYAAGYTGLSSDSASFSYSGVYQIAEGSQTDSLSFDLNYKNDFVVYTAENVCVNKMPGVILNTFKVSDCSKTTPFELWTAVNLSIQSASADIIFYDYASEQSLGKNITVTNTQLSNIILKLNSPFYGTSENATVTAEINGATRSSTVIIEPSTKNFVLNADNDGFHLVHGFSKTITVTASSIGDCNEPFPDSSVKYNLEIINGMQFGHLKNMLNGNVGESIQNIDQIEGSMKFQFIADGDIPVNEETITIRISASLPDITGTEISFFVNPNDILVTFLPPSIQPADTTDIVLKMRDSTGAVIDFPANQSFSLELTDGSDYGDILFLFRGMFWVDAKLLAYAYMPFKFAAVDMLLNGSVQTTILVSTDKDGKQLWGSGIITIGKDSSHIKAYFENSDLAPGDTVNVIVKKVDGNGNESDYPPGTPFEVAIVKGCGLGLINGTSDHLSNIQQPIKFVVADSLTGTDTVVVLRVGAPIVEESAANKKVVNTPALSKAKNAISNMKMKTAQNTNAKILAQTADEDVCTSYTPIYSDNSDAAATIKKLELEIIYPIPTTTEQITAEPKMPTVICKAKLTSNYQGVVKYEWKYIVRKFYGRRDINNSSICVRISKSEFKGLSYSDLGGEITAWTVPFDKDSGYFYFKSLQPGKNKSDPLNYIYGCAGETDKWYDTNKEIFTGGDVLITLTAKNYHTGKVLAILDTVHSGKILGINPDVPVIHAYANSNKIKAIMWQEGKTNHFTGVEINSKFWWPYNEEGWPLYGKPNGYGLMQLDNGPAATERQLWNWKANVDGGKKKLNSAYNEVFEYHGVPDEEKYNLTNAFQNYNRGNGSQYYTWDRSKKRWEINQNRRSEYGKKVYNKYIEFGGGN